MPKKVFRSRDITKTEIEFLWGQTRLLDPPKWWLRLARDLPRHHYGLSRKTFRQTQGGTGSAAIVERRLDWSKDKKLGWPLRPRPGDRIRQVWDHRHCEGVATKQSSLHSIDGLLRGACHRAAPCADPLAPRNDGESANAQARGAQRT